MRSTDNLGSNCNMVQPFCGKPELISKSFLVMGINSHLNADDDHTIQLEKENDKIFDEEDDKEVIQGITVKYITTAKET